VYFDVCIELLMLFIGIN